MEQYIMPGSAYRKLRAAKSLGQTAYIYGATGYGKTAFVQRVLEKRRHLYLSCGNRRWDEGSLPSQGSIFPIAERITNNEYRSQHETQSFTLAFCFAEEGFL